MYKIPTILRSNELIDKAFHKATKIPENLKIKNRIIRKKKNIISKIDAVSDVINSTLEKYISTFPSFDQVNKFDFELINILISIDKIRKSLGAIDWARKQILRLRTEYNKKLNKIKTQDQYSNLEELRRMFYGRITSILKQISQHLDFLNYARNQMKELPSINPELTTIVVAGFPNVGKSLFVRQISSAKPKIAKYPFTTQQLNIGHITINNQKVQVIDTPGLLDRNPEERNKIELQAIMALQYLADLIIFILDPSEHCGYTMDEQCKLLDKVRKLFKDVEILDVENKVDILSSSSDRLKISSLEGTNLDELMDVVRGLLMENAN